MDHLLCMEYNDIEKEPYKNLRGLEVHFQKILVE